MKFKILAIFLIFAISYLLIKASIPTIPTLNNRFFVCDLYNTQTWQASIDGFKYFKSINPLTKKAIMEASFHNKTGVIEFSCKTYLPILALYKANTLHLEIKANQKLDISINLKNSSGGVPFDPLAYHKPDAIVDLIYSLDQKYNPKINWLRSDFSEIVFVIKNLEMEELLIEIHNIYLI